MMDMVTLILACSLYPNNALPYAILQTGSQGNPLTVRTTQGQKSFKNVAAAMAYTQSYLDRGEPVWVGIMQLSHHWFSQQQPHVTLAELFEPCKNVVVATSVLKQLALHCATEAKKVPDLNLTQCILSRYATGDNQARSAYAEQVLAYTKTHSFTQLVEKARDPGMVAAVAQTKTKAITPPTSVALGSTNQKQKSTVS